jgi:hypothetical protein
MWQKNAFIIVFSNPHGETTLKKLAIAALAAFAIGTAAAEKLHGVEVYPGSKPDADTTQFLKTKLKMNGTAYVTGDSVDKVVAYYKSQPGLTQNPGADAKQAGFSGKGVMVTIQNPWADMKSGKINTTTLVSIVQQK